MNRNDYKPDDRLPVRYLPDTPAQSRIDTFVRQWYAAAIAFAASLLLLCLGIAITWWDAREQRLANQELGSIAATAPKTQS
jgi:hypothetical protein